MKSNKDLAVEVQIILILDISMPEYADWPDPRESNNIGMISKMQTV